MWFFTVADSEDKVHSLALTSVQRAGHNVGLFASQSNFKELFLFKSFSVHQLVVLSVSKPSVYFLNLYGSLVLRVGLAMGYAERLLCE